MFSLNNNTVDIHLLLVVTIAVPSHLSLPNSLPLSFLSNLLYSTFIVCFFSTFIFYSVCVLHAFSTFSIIFSRVLYNELICMDLGSFRLTV